jgi:hypothetical protein
MEMAERIAIVLELDKKLETLVGNTATVEGLRNSAVTRPLLRQYQ